MVWCGMAWDGLAWDGIEWWVEWGNPKNTKPSGS